MQLWIWPLNDLQGFKIEILFNISSVISTEVSPKCFKNNTIKDWGDGRIFPFRSAWKGEKRQFGIYLEDEEVPGP